MTVTTWPEGHECEWRYDHAEVPSDGPWVEREPTSLAWFHCQCGVNIEAPDGGPLPVDHVQAQAREHLISAGAPIEWAHP